MAWIRIRLATLRLGRRSGAAGPAKKMASLRKKGIDIQPVEIDGRKIAKTFWGEAWCDHLESFSDYANRLPRGRTYVRNGSVCHLEITKGEIEAKVAGSELYTVDGSASRPCRQRNGVRSSSDAPGKIGSLLELLQGKLSDQVMQIVTDRKEGLFPLPSEISFRCDCPDWAVMCKHVAAVLYGVGARLDASPELLFTLRGVDHEELIAADAEAAVSAATTSGKSKNACTRATCRTSSASILIPATRRTRSPNRHPRNPKGRHESRPPGGRPRNDQPNARPPRSRSPLVQAKAPRYANLPRRKRSRRTTCQTHATSRKGLTASLKNQQSDEFRSVRICE